MSVHSFSKYWLNHVPGTVLSVFLSQMKILRLINLSRRNASKSEEESAKQRGQGIVDAESEDDLETLHLTHNCVTPEVGCPPDFILLIF